MNETCFSSGHLKLVLYVLCCLPSPPLAFMTTTWPVWMFVHIGWLSSIGPSVSIGRHVLSIRQPFPPGCKMKCRYLTTRRSINPTRSPSIITN
ncbi:hypothetical protein GDO78_006727 [Eleutherodactylus coqui]|uniref:Uncharacterized protein n=1 Tax=Eleutherodactylus coqui TaxID=57060 RepID=A0A8J6KF02_ELECQ|nr:hypothetical protein GDO78_006727 [Eleutherodactylus coqui]